MTNKAEKKSFPRTYLYFFLFLVIIFVSIASAFFAFNTNPEDIFKLQKKIGIEIIKPNRMASLETSTFTFSDQTLSIKLPFKLSENKLFMLNDDIKYYVQDNQSFIGENDDLTIEIYSISFKKDLLPSHWVPSLENMAAVSVGALEKITDIKNLKSTQEKRTVSGSPAIEVKSTYTLNDTTKVQRVLHIANGFTTWSIKTNYNQSSDVEDLVTQALYSAMFK